MVSGTTTFPNSIGQMVEDKLSADPALKADWQEISARIPITYGDISYFQSSLRAHLNGEVTDAALEQSHT